MRKSALLSTIGALLTLLVLALAGCGSSSSAGSSPGTGATTSQSTANAAFCASLGDLETATANVKSIDPKNTTVTQLTTAATQLGAAWTSVEASAKDATGVDTAALTDAWSGVKAATQNLQGSGTTPSAAAQTLKGAIAPLQQAADDLKPQCEGVTTTGTTTGP